MLALALPSEEEKEAKPPTGARRKEDFPLLLEGVPAGRGSDINIQAKPTV